MIVEELDHENPKFLYLQVADIIESKIKNKEIKVGQRIPPQRELHKTFGVSLDTIKDALSSLTEEGYLSRRPKLGTFVVSSEPKNGIDLKRRNEISLVFCPYEEGVLNVRKDNVRSYMDKLIKGIEEKASEKGAYLVYSTMKEDKLSILGKEKEIAGLIIAGRITPERFRIIKKSGIPFVLIGDVYQKTATNGNVDVIAGNDFRSTYIAAKHLLDLGHKRIVYFTGSLKYSWDRKQLKGYEEALKEAGITRDKNLQIEVKGLEIDSGYKAMNKFVEKSISFTAIVYVNEYLGIGIIRALAEKGLKIPEDISVVGVGGMPELTLVTCDMEDVGKTAAERLIEKITNPDSKSKRIIVPSKLIARNSTRILK